MSGLSQADCLILGVIFVILSSQIAFGFDRIEKAIRDSEAAPARGKGESK